MENGDKVMENEDNVMDNEGKIFCGSCGSPNVAGAKFCTKCGLRLSSIESNTSNSGLDLVQQPARVPYQHVPLPPHMLEQVNQKGKGFAVAGLVLGIVSVVCCIFSYISAVVGVLGLIFSALAVQRPNGKGMGIAGLVLSIVGIGLSLFALVIELRKYL